MDLASQKSTSILDSMKPQKDYLSQRERGIVAETTYTNIIMLQGEGGGVRYTQCWCIVFGALLVTAIEQVDFIEGVPISKH